MNSITLTANLLIVEPQGLDKLWSFTRKLEIPLTHVRGATFDPGANAEPKGIRGPGLGLPGKWAGTFRRDGEKSFWNVDKAGDTIAIELDGESFARLFLTVAEPRRTVEDINKAIQT